MHQGAKSIARKPPPSARKPAGRARKRAKRPLTGVRRHQAWAALVTDAFAEDWENAKDAEYDRWQEHYGVSEW